MARTPPVKMSYPCNECSFEAQSARQLSRHKAVTHVENALKCVLCPFVTAYQTNLLRHRREVHGICGSKGNKSCKFCGFLSEDNETLIRHQLEVHRDILKSAQVKFAKELVSAGGEDNSGITGNQFPNTSDYIETQNRFEDESNVNRTQEEDEEDDDKNFWKEGFEDNGPNFYMNLASFHQNSRSDQSDPNASWYESSGQPSPPSHENSISEFVSSRASTPKVSKKMAIPTVAGNEDLPATRIRRQYTCNDCGFRTINPREFLYHRRDAHGQRLKIVECPYCVYACQYVQKLQRHLLLVHKLETSMTPPPEVTQTSSKTNKSKAIPKAQTIPKMESPDSLSEESAGTSQQNVVPKIRVKLPTLTSPAMVTTNQVSGPLPPPPKAKLVINQKNVSDHKRKIALQRQISANQKRLNDKSIFAKKYHKCQTCGYMTNVQYLFKKHMKYHSAPKIKCEMCDFESPYSWNVDRHVRSHFSNGLFKCTKCSFACDKKQALTVHMTQHHRDKTGEQHSQQSVDTNLTDDKPPEEEGESEIQESMEDNEEETESLAHLFTQTLEEGNASVRPQTTYVRQTDGKIVAKQGVVKKCKYCNFQTDTFAKLQKHESTTHPEKRFQCPLCEIKFENLVWLQRHLTHMHQEDSQANNIVTILEQLNPKRKRNKALPSTSTPNSQNIPEVMALTQSNSKQNPSLKRKQQVIDKSQTQCQVCGYQTRWISELEKHMRVHTKERPFACPYCSFKSKWKGDLNRHIQKYHSRLPMPDLNLMEQQIQSQSDVSQNANENSMEWMPTNIPQESSAEYENDASILSGEVEYEDFDDNIEEIKMDDKPLPDDYEERPLVFDDLSDDNEDNEDMTGIDMGDDDNENELHIDFDDKEGMVGNENAGPSESPNETKSGKVKMYRCSYCDFTCSTASRFHVHFVQHLNTKPFQCSVCGHRSNWEWDVTKHIKMKSQRDPKHVNAKAMLVHESGKRDYSKYNKYVVWVNQKEAIANNVSNPKIDFRAKRAKLDATDGVEYEDNEVNHSNEVEYEDENSYNCDPESIVITPDICFEVQGEEDSTAPNVQYNQGFNPSLQPNVPYNSNSNSDDTKLLQCSYCDFKHKESKVMVSHLSSHAGMKPYRCRRCGFDSNWREVVVRHCVARHQTNSEDVEQRFRCTVNKSFCKIVDDNIAPKSLGSTPNSHLPSAVQAFQESHQSVRISGFKGSFVCDLCPFRAEKAFHMDFHVKRHQPSSGPFKCPHCPYWVNAKKSLVKHMLLHADNEQSARNQSTEPENGVHSDSRMNTEMEDEMNDDMSENELVINEDNEQQKYLNQSNLSLSAVRQSASVSKNRCDKCPFIAGTKTQLLYHKQFHRPNRSAQYSCTLCTYSVSYLHLLNQHMKVHYQSSGDQMPVNYYELPQEEESLLEESDDRDESDIPFTWVQIGNNKRKLFQCRFCSTTSKRRTYIYVHERLHTQNTNETFKCSQPDCQFETRDSTQFLSHLNQHKTDSTAEQQKEEIPKLDTNESSLSTPSVSVIDVNSFRHGNRRMFSYVCPDCPAAFKSPGDLKIHSAFHNTEYDHHCFYCSYKAKNKPQLCKHLYVHTTEYIAKRANSYPDGTKLLIGNAVDHMKRDMKSPLKEGSTEDKRDNSSTFQSLSGATSLLKKTDKSGQSSPPWTGIAKELNGGNVPKRVAMIGNDGRSPREQMLLLEMTESNAYLEKLRTGVKHRFIYRCSHCPAVFMKVNTLTFHISMHGNEEQNKCKLCSYSTNSANNLMVHQQLHNYSSFASVGHSVYNHRCNRCPAAFSKKSRLEKHITLHGLDAKWKCDKCDYAVHYAATLVKHRACHQMNPNFKALPLENRDNQLETTELKQLAKNQTQEEVTKSEEVKPSIGSPKETTSPASPSAQNSESNVTEKEEKILYCCDRCPYVHNRKDAVQSHLKRHDQQIRNVRDGKQCPYCDYTCLQPSYLREHIQWHFEPQHDRKPTLFTFWDNLEVWKLETIDSQQNCDKKSDSEDKSLLFKDKGVANDIRNRFEPPEDDPEYFELYDSFVAIDSESEEENEPPINDLSDDILS